MKYIDEDRLETDLEYRFGYVAEFMGFGAQEVAAIHATAGKLAPWVPAQVDAVYDKLFGYDATKRHFVPRQYAYEGPVPDSLATLTQDHPMIAFRKKHLGRYLSNLVTKPYDGKMLAYLDFAGKIHMSKAGSPELNVPLVQMNALLGFVSDALTATILGLGLDRDSETRTLRAFNKLLWIQNDLIARHYPEPAHCGRLLIDAPSAKR